MPGFVGMIGKSEGKEPFTKSIDNKLINKILQIYDLYIEQRTVSKFTGDKLFEENEEYFILTEGVILNIIEIMKKYKGKSFFDSIIIMYKENGNSFFNEFRGSFSGVFYDKKNDKKIVYTNHIGDKQVFYSKAGNNLVFGSEINYIVDYYKRNNIEYSFNNEAAYYLLTFGYMLEDHTLFNEIKKLIAGHYILIENGEIDIIQYYKLDNTPNYNQSEEEIIENIDSLFRQAIKRAFNKDKEYGYKHLVALSGGLDSRMTTWVAHDMGYKENIVNYTFSQSNYLDETIPKKIASDLRHEWIFKSLDNGLFLKSIEDVVKISSGEVLYYGLAHGKSCLDLINLDEFGIVHTGQVGGIVKGYYNNQDNVEYSGSYSSFLLDKIDYTKLKTYNNEGEFKLYNRQFNGTLLGNLPIQERTDTISPFLDVDLMNYCLKIPNIYKKNEIFIKWMLRKYPKSTDYIWEATKGKVTDKSINIFGRQVLLKQLPIKSIDYLMRKLKIKKSVLSSKNHMNPLDYWYDTNEDLKKIMDNYYESNINRLNFDEELMKDCKYLYNKGNSIEKNQVLTLLAALKLYF